MNAYKTNEPKWDFTVTESLGGEMAESYYIKRPKRT